MDTTPREALASQSPVPATPPDRRPALLAVPAWGLFVLAVFYTLYFAASLLVPVTAAILLNAIFAPLVRFLARKRIPNALGAALIVFLMTGTLALSTVLLSGPVKDWMNRLPNITWEVRDKLETLLAPVENVKQASKEVDKLAQAASGADSDEGTSQVTIKGPSFMSQVFESLQTVFLQLAVIGALLFFLLAWGDHFKERFVALVPGHQGKRQTLEILRKIEKDSSSYVLTVSMINLILGAAIGS